MKKKVRKKNFVQKKYLFSETKKYSLSWIFGSSHFLVALFCAVGLFFVSQFLGSFFEKRILFTLCIYLFFQLVFAIDYYFDRHIDEKFLFFFYFYSAILLVLFLIFGVY